VLVFESLNDFLLLASHGFVCDQFVEENCDLADLRK
jgi:hypothetical protein